MTNIIRRRYRTFSLLLSILFSFFSFGCKIYHRQETSVDQAIHLKGQYRVFYVLDADQPEKIAWRVKSETDTATSGGVTGTLIRMTEKEAKAVHKFQNEQDVKAYSKSILLYTSPTYTQTLADTIQTTVPFKEVQRVEVYEKNKGASKGASTVLIVIGVAALAVIIAGLIFSESFSF